MIDTVKESLCINKIVGNKTFQIMIEGDSIIPDTKPDILRDICASGNVCIYKKEILEGKIRLDGNVNIYLMYLADGEGQNTRAFNANLDFTEILDFKEANNQMTLDEEITIKSIECKVLNGRKVSFRVSLEVRAKLFLNENEEMVREIRGIEDIQLQSRKLQMNSLVGQNTTKTSCKENLTVSDTDNIEEILSVSYSVINKDTKVSYNKVLAKADVEIKVLYLTDDGRIRQIEERLPLMGFIDLVGVTEDDFCDVKYKLKNIMVKPNAIGDHAISVEMEFEIFCRVFENKEISVIQDLYSPTRNLEVNQSAASTMVNMKNTKNTINVREKVKLEDEDYSQIAYARIEGINVSQNIVRDMVKYEGDLNVRFILLNNDESDARVQEVKVPFTFNQGIDGVDKESRVDLDIIPVFQEFTKDGMEVSIRADLEASTSSYDLERINLIDNIQETECSDDNPYSMIIYFVKPGDSLWKIAKKYKSTVADIARINNIENPDKLSVRYAIIYTKM